MGQNNEGEEKAFNNENVASLRLEEHKSRRLGRELTKRCSKWARQAKWGSWREDISSRMVPMESPWSGEKDDEVLFDVGASW